MKPGRKEPRSERRRFAAFQAAIDRKARRRARAARDRDRTIWSWLGMMGLVGWSVAIPAVVGAFAGQWLDARLDSDVSWTITGVVLGMTVGCLQAWYWIERESKRD